MNTSDLRQDIRTALQSFQLKPLRKAAIALLNTLGYHSDKTIDIPDSKPQAFLQLLTENDKDKEFNRDKALFNDWRTADILFQLTDEELSDQSSLFRDNTVNTGLLQSYLFFAIELKQCGHLYSKGQVEGIARQLNRLFPMPVMVLIKHRGLLSIAVINRRRHLRDADKDVLGTVTLIHDIALANPHRDHLDSLQSCVLPDLLQEIDNLDALHTAWEKNLDVEPIGEEPDYGASNIPRSKTHTIPGDRNEWWQWWQIFYDPDYDYDPNHDNL